MRVMSRESPYPMLSVEAARALVMSYATPLDSEVVDALTAEGRILATDLSATKHIPDLPKSAMDGYALRSSDGLAPRQIVAELTAGAVPRLLIGPGEAARIMTGAPMPAGADAMIPVELTQEHNGIVTIERLVQPGDYVHPVGHDLLCGQMVLDAGTLLGSAEVGMLATLGMTQVPVFCRPRVAVLATGDEVYEPGERHPPGAIYDSNRYALLAAVREAGGIGISLGIARDDEVTQRTAMLHGIEQADILITSGGVSMGSHDLIKPILAEMGSIHFGRVNVKPGKPTTFATVGGTMIFGLPGYPVSSLVAFEIFVRPVIRALQGDKHPYRSVVQVTLSTAIHPSPDRPEYQRVTLRWQAGKFWATTTGNQGSSRLLSLRGANGLLIVPAGDRTYNAGEELEALVIGEKGMV